MGSLPSGLTTPTFHTPIWNAVLLQVTLHTPRITSLPLTVIRLSDCEVVHSPCTGDVTIELSAPSATLRSGSSAELAHPVAMRPATTNETTVPEDVIAVLPCISCMGVLAPPLRTPHVAFCPGNESRPVGGQRTPTLKERSLSANRSASL